MATILETFPDPIAIIFNVLLGAIVAFAVEVGKNGFKYPYKIEERYFLGSVTQLLTGALLGVTLSVSVESLVMLGTPDFVLLMPTPMIIVVCCISGIFIYDWKFKIRTPAEEELDKKKKELSKAYKEIGALEQRVKDREIAEPIGEAIAQQEESVKPPPVYESKDEVIDESNKEKIIEEQADISEPNKSIETPHQLTKSEPKDEVVVEPTDSSEEMKDETI